MRLGVLILQICAVLIAAALLIGGYGLYRNKQITQFEQVMQRYDPTTPAALLSIIQDAPSAICTETGSSFAGASKVTSYHYNGKARFDFTNITTGKTTYEIFDEDGLYVWASDSDSIARVSRDLLLGQEFGKEERERFYPVLYSLTCEVWWTPDKDAFRIPANLPILEYDA